MARKTLSLIVPVRNEAAWVAQLPRIFARAAPDECIVVDTSAHPVPLVPAGVRYLHRPAIATRAGAQNEGAAAATGDFLWFLHADCMPAADAADRLRSASPGVRWGGFAKRYRPDSPALWLQARALNASCRLFGFPIVGTNGIFAERALFLAAGGFSNLPLLEDLDFGAKLRRKVRPRFLCATIEVSSRNYPPRGRLPRMLVNLRILCAYLLGADPATLVPIYRAGGDGKNAPRVLP